LYEYAAGISSNGEGRELYLKKRNTLMPNQKYRINPTSNTEYGWDTEKLKTMTEIPTHGRKQSLKFSTYSKHGFNFNTESP
jgi:hypothetical protein